MEKTDLQVGQRKSSSRFKGAAFLLASLGEKIASGPD